VKRLSKRALAFLHEENLAQFGGKRGLRNEALLDSTQVRPVLEMAAAYGYRITRKCAFVDGNTRAGFLAIGLILEMNGYRLKADQVDAIETMRALGNGKLTEKALAEWIKKNSAKARK
jgi:death on curing protein